MTETAVLGTVGQGKLPRKSFWPFLVLSNVSDAPDKPEITADGKEPAVESIFPVLSPLPTANL